MAEKNNISNPECKSEHHSEHLCYFVSQGFHLTNDKEYNNMVQDPQFKCQHCGRVANKADNLCKPVKL
jgi:hypothetical protein